MKKKSNFYLDIGAHLVLIIATIVAIFPLVWIIISSIKGKGELTQFPTRFWPQTFTLDYFTHVINDLHFVDNVTAFGNNLYFPTYFASNTLFYCNCKSRFGK